jgi:hypothetical protein
MKCRVQNDFFFFHSAFFILHSAFHHMKRSSKGRFAKGNTGGPGRPKKKRPEPKTRYKLFACSPPKDCDCCVQLDWMHYGKWWATEVQNAECRVQNDQPLYEVRSGDALRESYIQFRKLPLEGIEIVGVRVVRDIDLLEEPIRPDIAAE